MQRTYGTRTHTWSNRGSCELLIVPHVVRRVLLSLTACLSRYCLWLCLSLHFSVLWSCWSGLTAVPILTGSRLVESIPTWRLIQTPPYAGWSEESSFHGCGLLR